MGRHLRQEMDENSKNEGKMTMTGDDRGARQQSSEEESDEDQGGGGGFGGLISGFLSSLSRVRLLTDFYMVQTNGSIWGALLHFIGSRRDTNL